MAGYVRSSCRLCGSARLSKRLVLTPTPPANAFVSTPVQQRRYPLDVYACEACHHVQLRHVVDPKELFSDYVYASGTSSTFVRHFEGYAADVVKRLDLGGDELVVEIGGNDGTFLAALKHIDPALRVLSVEPARRIAKLAEERGIETMVRFFSESCTKEIREAHGPASVVVANNVFAHIDDLHEVVRGVQHLLVADGTFVFEVQYLRDFVEKGLFDMTYHEHLAYWHLEPMRPFFAGHGMRLLHAERVPTHGGSLRCYVQRVSEGTPTTPEYAALLAEEAPLKLHDATTWGRLEGRIDEAKRELHALLINAKAQGKRIAAYGAPAKFTTLAYHFGLSKDVIDFVVDDSPLKQGLFTPGLHIPVLPATALYTRKPDLCLVTAWNFADSIIEKHRNYGGRFIVPFPKLEAIA